MPVFISGPVVRCFSPKPVSKALSTVSRYSVLKLKSPEKFTRGSFDRFSDSQECLDGDDFFAALDFTKIFRIQIHLLGQPFLGVANVFPMEADGFANHPPVS